VTPEMENRKFFWSFISGDTFTKYNIVPKSYKIFTNLIYTF
jgi:hypothetical protein